MNSRSGFPWNKIFAWFWILFGFSYFVLPLIGTFIFSLRMQRDTLSFAAYEIVFQDSQFHATFLYSTGLALGTIALSLLLIVPTAYWVNLKLPRVRPYVEFVTLMPFVVPAIVLVFGLIRLYSRELTIFGITIPALAASPILLVFGYVILSFPYMYAAVDNGLRAIDIRTLTEAAQSLGASWFTILWRVIFPNLRVALLSGAFLTFAIVIGEFTMATLLNWPAFGPYLALLGVNRAYEPAALTIVSFALTWLCIGLIQFLSRGGRGQGQVAGAR